MIFFSDSQHTTSYVIQLHNGSIPPGIRIEHLYLSKSRGFVVDDSQNRIIRNLTAHIIIIVILWLVACKKDFKA
jgi:hypothetical protein